MTSSPSRRAPGRKVIASAMIFALAGITAACGSSSGSSGSGTTVATTAGGAATTSAATTAAGASTTAGGAATSAGATTTAKASKSETLKLGSVFSLSGSVAPFTEGSVHAVNLAIKQINDAGGFTIGDTNYKLDVKMLDDRSDPAVASASATQLVEDEGVKFMLGPTTSVTSPAVAEVVVPQGVLMFSPANSLFPMFTPDLAKGDNHTLFNTSADPAAEVSFHQQALKKWYPNVKKVAAIYDDGAIGKGTGPLFVQAAKANGLDVVAEEVYPAKNTDFSAQLTAIKAKNPDLLFVCCTSTTNSLLVKQANELNVAPAFISKGGSLRPPTSDATGGPITQPYVSTIAPGEMEILKDGTVVAPRPGYQKYLSDLKSELGVEPSVNENGALYFYDYVYMLVEAMKQAGTVTDTKAIADKIESMDFSGPTLGPIKYQPSHLVRVPADSCMVTNGKVDCVVLQPPS
jgi:branched-chain amino acid transport system substrate-binding protein